MHYLPFTFLATLLFIGDVSACMHYAATFPYSTSLPFEATLTDNGVVTCWASMTYDQHNRQQMAFSNYHHAKPRKRQMEVQVSLTGEPDSSTSPSPTRTVNKKSGGERSKEGVGSKGGKEESVLGSDEPGWGTDEEENGVGVWLPWEFQCLDGYQAHAGVGLRAVWYKAHGQEFDFVPEMEEDVLGEKWVYGVDLWC
jgi:hypothetical protein